MAGIPPLTIPVAFMPPPAPAHEPIPGEMYSFACTCGAAGAGTREDPHPYQMHLDALAGQGA